MNDKTENKYIHRMELDDYYFSYSDKLKVSSVTKNNLLFNRESFINRSNATLELFEDRLLVGLSNEFNFGYVLQRPVFDFAGSYYFVDFYIPKFFLCVKIVRGDYELEKQNWKSKNTNFKQFYKRILKPSEMLNSHKTITLTAYEIYNERKFIWQALMEWFYEFKAPNFRSKKQRLV